LWDFCKKKKKKKPHTKPTTTQQHQPPTINHQHHQTFVASSQSYFSSLTLVVCWPDNIEANMTSVDSAVEGGVQQLTKASTYQVWRPLVRIRPV
jgi:hypothetical protein